jgi:Ca2+/Na+ antiporter
MTPISGPDHNHLTIGKADINMRTFLALLLTGILLSIVGAFVEGLPWLTAVGMLTFFSAAVYAVLSSRSQERRDDELTQRQLQPMPEKGRGRRASSFNDDAHQSDTPAGYSAEDRPAAVRGRRRS